MSLVSVMQSGDLASEIVKQYALLDCMTIAEAIPMQMASSVLLQTGVEKELLGRVSSTIRMVSTTGIALGNFLFGALNDLTVVWLPIFLGAAGVACASVLYRKIKTPAG